MASPSLILLQLEVTYADGSSDRIVSDNSWLTHPGPVTYSSTYAGEDFDAGALPEPWDMSGFAAEGWKPALEVKGPGGVLAAGESAPLVIAQTYQPVHVTHPAPV